MTAIVIAFGLAVALAVLLVVALAVLGRSIHAEDQAGDLPTRPPTALTRLARHLLGLHAGACCTARPRRILRAPARRMRLPPGRGEAA